MGKKIRKHKYASKGKNEKEKTYKFVYPTNKYE